MSLNLALFSSVLQGASPWGDIGAFSVGYRRSIRRNGGCWLAQLDFAGGLMDQKQIFNELIGFHFEEKSPKLTWAGMVYDLEFSHNGHVKRRTLESVYNAVKTVTVDANGNPVDTGWATDDRSLARYGRKEEIISMDGYDTTAAQSRRATRLKEAAWPWPRTVSISAGRGSVLTIRIAGYIFTANWRYTTANDGATGDANAWVSNIRATDLQFITAGRIKQNTLQLQRTQNMAILAGDKLFEIGSLGDASGNLWEVGVGPERQLYYHQADVEPVYKWIDGDLQTWQGESINPWEAWPGVVRDDAYPVSRAEPGSPYLSDARDALIEEIEVGESGLVLKVELDGPANVLFAQQEYMYAMSTYGDDPSDDEPQKGRGNKWKKKKGLRKEKTHHAQVVARRKARQNKPGKKKAG